MATSKEITDEYVSPFALRWSTPEMLAIWSQRGRYTTFRRLWVALAKGQRKLGLKISAEQVAELEAAVEDINFERGRELEREIRHEQMAQIRAYGELCPEAAGIIHLGATSCYVSDNAELIQMRDSMEIVRGRLVNIIDRLGDFAEKWRDLPALAYTHFQPAQLTTVGKRACLWAQDFVMDLDGVESWLGRLKFRGVKGATGTQASFLQLFDGDHSKVEALEAFVAREMGFDGTYPVTGQTYPRKVDWQALSVLSGGAQSAHKYASDMRLLQNLKEMEEPFGETQVGSSAMAYKRNPMRSERVCGLARFVIGLEQSAAHTAAAQWFERTLDDSANRRLTLPEGFLATDALLNLVLNVASGMVVREPVIRRRVYEQAPFMATESVLMACARAGGDRQALHERIREHSMAVARAMSEQGAANDLLDRLAADEAFAAVRDRLPELTDPRRFIGRCPEQVDAFVSGTIHPIRERYGDLLGADAELRT